MAQPPALRPWIKGLLLAHRYLGVLLAPVFLLWFASGLVTVFVPFPEHDRADRRAEAPPLAAQSAKVQPATAWARAAGGPAPESARVAMRDGRPVYHFRSHGRWGSVFADTGGLAPPIGPAAAEALVARLTDASQPRHLERLTHPDQWTFAAVYRGYRPLHRVALNEGGGTVVYLSARTGEIVQRVSREQRLWAYAGPVAHRLYPEWLRSHHRVWKATVVALSGLGALVCLSGLVLGGLALIRRPALIPWRFHGAHAWHHYLGLAFGLFAFTWSLSGLLTVDPWGWPGSGADLPGHLRTAERLDLAAFRRPPAEALAALKDSGLRPRALELIQVGEAPWYVAYGAADETRLVSAAGPLEVRRRLDRADLVAAVTARLGPEAVAGAGWLHRADGHYYPDRGVRLGQARLRWPVLRVRLARPAGARLYLDPFTGKVVRRVDAAARRERWLATGLHRLDPPVLATNRGWWYPLVAALLMGGTLLAGSALVVAGRWLAGRRRGRRRS